MRILVTGGAGFIGSNFTYFILENHPDYKVIVFDILNKYSANPDIKIKFKNYKNFKFVKGDITNKKQVEKIVKKIDVIVNFAAETHVDRSIIEPDLFIKTNVFGTKILLDAAKKFKIKKFIQISTDEVYGSMEKGRATEEFRLNPGNPYAATKAAADLLAISYFNTFKVPVIITRSSNNFGPYQFPEKFIPLFITNAIENKELPLYGDGKNIRNWIYVEDNCRAIDLVMQKGKPGEIYNIGGNIEIRNIDVAKKILNLLGKPESLIKFIKDRPGHDRRYSLDYKKIAKLGWQPKFQFEEALEKTVEWYSNNYSWWKKLKGKNFKKYYNNWYKKILGGK